MTQTISQQNKPSFTLNCKEEEESWDDIEFPDSGLFYTNNNEKDYGLSTTTRDMSGITIHDSSDDDSSEGNNCDESTSASSTSSSSSTNNSINKVKEMMINRGVVATNDKDEFSGLITRLVGKNNKVLIGDDWDNDMEIPEDGFANLTITSNNNIGGKRSKSRCSSITVTSCNNITNNDYYDFDSWNEEEEDDDKKIVNDNDFITSPRQLVIKRIEDPSKVFSTSKDTKGKSVESFDDDFDFSEVDLNRLNLSAEMLKFYQESDHEVIDKDPFGSEKLSSRNSSRLSILPSPAPTNSSQSAFESGEEEELFDDLQFPEHMDSLTLSPHLKPNSTNGNDVHDTINYKDDDDDLENGLDIEDESAFAPDKLKNKNIITRPSTTQSKRTRRESFTIEFAPSQIINNLPESDHLTATQELRTPDITSREELLYCKSSSSESTVSTTSTLSKDSRPSTPLPSKTAEASTRRHPSPITFVKNKVYPNTGGKKSNNGDNNSYRNIHSSTPPVSSLHRLKTNKVFSKSLTSLTTTTTASTSNFKQNASSKSQKNPKSPNLTVKGVIPPNNNNTSQVKAKRSIITNTTNSTNNKTTSKKTAIGNTTSTTSIKTKSIKANCSTLLNKHNNNNNNNKNNNNRPTLLKTNPMPSSFNNLNNLHAPSKRRFQQNTTFNTTSTLVDSILEIMRKPRRQQSFGDGTELDVFDDLPVNLDRECSSNPTNNNTKQDRKNSTSSAGSNHDNLHQGRKKKNRKGKKPQLIRNLNLDKNTKAVGEMVYNPITQRWDGNESVLKEFDNANSPTRPALISNMNYHSTNTKSLQLVGNMKFDPTKMCWNNDYSDDDAIWDSDSGNDSKEKEDIDSDDFCNFNSLQAFSDNDISYSSIKIKKNRLIHQNRNTDSTGGDSNDFQVGSEFDITPGFKAALLASERQHRNEISRWYPGALSKDNDSRFGLRDVTLQRSYLYELRNNKPSSGNNSKINHDRSGGLFEAAMNLTRHERRHFR